eukprot:scaffold106777_cov54-Phaeocystis_antarctica.AAC.1
MGLQPPVTWGCNLWPHRRRRQRRRGHQPTTRRDERRMLLGDLVRGRVRVRVSGQGRGRARVKVKVRAPLTTALTGAWRPPRGSEAVRRRPAAAARAMGGPPARWRASCTASAAPTW